MDGAIFVSNFWHKNYVQTIWFDLRCFLGQFGPSEYLHIIISIWLGKLQNLSLAINVELNLISKMRPFASCYTAII